jgi:hypothetical protein
VKERVLFSDGDHEVLERRGLFGQRLYLRYDTGDLAGTLRTDRIGKGDAARVRSGEGAAVVLGLKRQLGW